MKNLVKSKTIIMLGSLAGTCLMATVVFGNPSMLPDHPGYPMQGLKSPVTNVPTANDPGRDNLYEQEALNAAIEAFYNDRDIRRAGQFGGVNQSEGQNQIGGQEPMTRQN